MKPSSSRPLSEFDERLPWVLIAVDRFGSFGSDTAAGELLQRAKLIEPKGDAYALTPKGVTMVRRIHNSRGPSGFISKRRET